MALFALPACAADRWLARRGVTDERVRLAAPLALAGVLGYVAFFVYFLHPELGRAFAVAVPVASAAYLVRSRREPRPARIPSNLRLLALLGFGIGLFYLALLYLPDLSRPPEAQSQVRFLYEFPMDSNLPLLLGDRLYAGESPKPFLPEAGWLSSDRPPLQAGLYLLVRPWLTVFSQAPGLGYQCVGTLAQLCWLPALWLVGRRLELDRARLMALLGLAAATGLLLFNSTYVWPKLLAGGYVLIAALLWLDRSAPRPPAIAALAATCAALGWLAHGAAAFSLLPLGLLLLLPRLFPGWRNVLAAALVFAVLSAPWTAYQKFYDPPANRLMKWHLAGVIPIDSRTTWEAIRDAYSGLPPGMLLANKRANFGTLINGSFLSAVDVFTTAAYPRKVDEFFYVFRSLGVLNLAWILAPAAWLLRRRLPPRFGLQASVLGWTALTLAFWTLALFNPASTILHSSSYAMMLGLLGLALVFLLQLPRWLGLPVLGWHLLGFALTWLPYYHSAPLDPVMIVLVVFAGAGVGAVLFRAATRKSDAPSSPPV